MEKLKQNAEWYGVREDSPVEVYIQKLNIETKEDYKTMFGTVNHGA